MTPADGFLVPESLKKPQNVLLWSPGLCEMALRPLMAGSKAVAFCPVLKDWVVYGTPGENLRDPGH